jgi:hypothetical protein
VSLEQLDQLQEARFGVRQLFGRQLAAELVDDGDRGCALVSVDPCEQSAPPSRIHRWAGDAHAPWDSVATRWSRPLSNVHADRGTTAERHPLRNLC